MPGRLLDTNAVIALQRNEASLVVLLDTDDWFLNAVVVGELYYGAYRSRHVSENVATIDRLVAQCSVIPVDHATARVFGEIHQQLRAVGRPIPENDIWIAATALQHRLTLVTRDAHFDEVPGLMMTAW